MPNSPASERHPLEPFIPDGAKVLMLGSFPPNRERWSMEFYYPNLQNDMWRIFGLAFFGDRNHFLDPASGKFDRDAIIKFLTDKGIALSDTARAVVRLKDNASDKFLQVTEAVDLEALLAKIPCCEAIVTTGEKATQTLVSLTGAPEPRVGGNVEFEFAGRTMTLWRMPSSSRAYPKPLAEKAAVYQAMFSQIGLIEPL